jgi:hypothetical protein
MARSPAALISQTVPSGSTRPNRCGSLCGAGVTRWVVGPAVGRGPGRGLGRGTGTETGGAESSILGSSAVMRSSPTLCTFARPITAHPPRLAAPCGRADWYHQAPSTGTTVFKSIQAGWRAVRGHLERPSRQVGAISGITSCRSGRGTRVDWGHNETIPPSIDPYGGVAPPGNVAGASGAGVTHEEAREAAEPRQPVPPLETGPPVLSGAAGRRLGNTAPT